MEDIATDRRPIAFIVEQQAFDYSPATAFAGQIEFMEVKRFAPHAPSAPGTWNKDVLRLIRRDLSNYIPGYDYIVPTGAPTRMVAIGAVLREKGPKHKILGWDAKTQRYLEYIVDFS